MTLNDWQSRESRFDPATLATFVIGIVTAAILATAF
jgi:hypothetical protein